MIANSALAVRAIALLSILASAVIPASSPALSQTLEQVKQKGSITFGVRIDTPRFGGLNPATNEISGFEIDLAKAIASRIIGNGAKTQLVPVTSQNRIAQLNSNRVDLLIAAITVTEPRMQEVEFSNVYMRAGQSLLVRNNSEIGSYKDLDGKAVCTVVGSTPEQTIRKMAPKADVVLFNTYPECLISLRNGRVDAMTTGLMLLRDFYDANKTTTKIVGDIFTFEAWSLAARKSDGPLIEAVNRALSDLYREGVYKTLYEHWIEKPMPADTDSWIGMPPAKAAELFARSAP